MGLFKAFSGALGGMFADQWKDFLTVPSGLSPTALLFPAIPQGQNAGRGSNTSASANIITNGSKILVPEGYGLLTFEDGKIAALATDAGGYEFRSNAQDTQSMFAGDGFFSSTLKTSWERFKFGGRPGSQQLAFFVNLKEIPNNRFGTQSEVYWDDAYLNAQVGAVTRGTYTLRVIDPILFVCNFVPATYISAGAPVFDLADMDNPVGQQLFNEVVGSLAPAFSHYTNDPSKGNRMAKIQGDSLGFAQSMSAAVEQGYQWSSDRGITIVKTAIISIEYDEDTRALLSDVKKADALSGGRSASFLNQAVARGVQSAGESGGGGAGLAMFGMGAGAVGNMVQQPVPQQPAPPAPAPAAAAPAAPAAPAEKSPMEKLTEYKQMLDGGLITQEDYDAAKKAILGL